MKSGRKVYLDNIRWITVCIVVIYHVIYMFNGVQFFGVIGHAPPVLIYLLTGCSAFAGAFVLDTIISRIPVLRWCVLGIKKVPK